MCDQQRGHRFDPGQCSGICQVCGVYSGVEPGQPMPPHQPQGGGREMCSGAGTPAG
ncbi:hypothetical protein [Streptomyces silaceus]|uniref:hypothetical protein n=1 Tax=Streptomyces silaceus TaxID=545123 RepID=UPI000A7C44DC|nr:hypothetical protein [Streptomyces silaceus]